MEQCSDEHLFVALDSESNSIAIIVKHMVGNMRSRWRNFLTTDGEKPDRNRDTEFEDAPKSREELMAMWGAGWKYVFDALESLVESDIGREVTDSHRTSLRHASHQPPGRPLFHAHRPNRLRRKTHDRRQNRQMAIAEHSPRPIRPIHRRRRRRQKIPALIAGNSAARPKKLFTSDSQPASRLRFLFAPISANLFM